MRTILVKSGNDLLTLVAERVTEALDVPGCFNGQAITGITWVDGLIDPVPQGLAVGDSFPVVGEGIEGELRLRSLAGDVRSDGRFTFEEIEA